MDKIRAYDLQMMAFGKATDLLFRSPRRSFSLAAAHVWLTPPIRLNQIAVSQDARGAWTGYITWAYLSEQVARKMPDDPPFLEISEWNEGDQLWIIDAVGLPGTMQRLASKLSCSILPNFRSAKRLVRGKDGKVKSVREVKRRLA